MTLERVAGRLQCVALNLESVDHRRAISSKTVRDVPVGRLVAEAILKEYRWALADSIPTPEPGDGLVWDYNQPDAQAKRERAAFEEQRGAAANAALALMGKPPPAPKARQRYGADHWRAVIDCYSEAVGIGVPAQAAVAERFGVSRSKAGVWISRARPGRLAPTSRGVKSAEPPDTLVTPSHPANT